MKFGFKALIAAGLLAGGLSAGISSATAMPMAGASLNAPAVDNTIHADKVAFLCIGRCYHRPYYGRPFVRGYRGYGPYAYYGRPYHRFGYYR